MHLMGGNKISSLAEDYYQLFSRGIHLLSATSPYGVTLASSPIVNAPYKVLRQLKAEMYKVLPNAYIATNEVQ